MWFGRAREREVSKSMIAFTLAVLGVLALAGMAWVPGLIGKDSGVHVTRPGLFTVEEAASGIATLTGGASVTLYDSGLRVSDRSGVLVKLRDPRRAHLADDRDGDRLRWQTGRAHDTGRQQCAHRRGRDGCRAGALHGGGV